MASSGESSVTGDGDDRADGGVSGGLRHYGLVRVRRLLNAPETYDGWRVNQRPPRAGDVGTLLDVLTAPGHPDRYVVECSGEDGVSIWLADFLAEEIEPVGDWAVHRARLSQFFGGYFHQDWPLEGDDWPAIVTQYLREVDPDEGRALADAIDALVRSTPDDAEMERIVHHDLGCDYDPRPDLGGPTLRQWLGQVADALRTRGGEPK